MPDPQDADIFKVARRKLHPYFYLANAFVIIKESRVAFEAIDPLEPLLENEAFRLRLESWPRPVVGALLYKG